MFYTIKPTTRIAHMADPLVGPYANVVGMQPPMQAPPQPTIIDAIFDPLENLMAMFGLVTPVSRAVFGMICGATVVFLTKPSSVFLPNGTPRQFTLLLPPAERDQGTWVPWYAWILIPGILLGFLI